jgi:predicted O-linked N-acetylglucosamine transferase (SPINDLY family)
MSQDRESRAFHKARLNKQKQKVSGLFAQAVSLHQRGLIAEAQVLYRQILQQVPGHFEALHHLGVTECQSGRHAEADRLLEQALRLEPRSPAAWSDRGIVLHEMKRFEDALACFDQALAVKPDFAQALSNRGNTLIEIERYDEAVASYDRAIAHNPNYAEAFNNRGHALKEIKRFDDAVASCDRAIALKPDYADAFSNRGFALIELKRFDEALASFEKAIAINPRLAAAWLGRGNVFLNANAFTEALVAYNKALAIRPDYFKALHQIAACYRRQGNIAAAVSHYDKALAIAPDFADAISNRIFALDFAANADFADHQTARRQWWVQVGAKIAATSRFSHVNSHDAARRLVIGYVSSDFNRHSAATAFKPVLRHHDKTRFEVICYSCSLTEDEETQEFRRLADVWRDGAQWSDDHLAEQINADHVDILVDLSGHSAGNRLGVFARKPAPVQVTAWGHASGTGLATVDYLFSDPVAIPKAVRHLFAETIYDLPCLITMEPPPYGRRPADPPICSRGFLTFGCFNRIGKISDEAVAAWAKILQAVSQSKLLIKDGQLDDLSLRAAFTEKFTQHDIAADRIGFMGSTSREAHLGALDQVDICLDPFPQNGGISTWEALHMGVPVVAKLGHSLPSRLSGAILSSVGMNEWVAGDIDQYQAIALKYAGAPEVLKALRHELPTRISASAASNSAAYTEAVEAAYRIMWETYAGAKTTAAIA